MDDFGRKPLVLNALALNRKEEVDNGENSCEPWLDDNCFGGKMHDVAFSIKLINATCLEFSGKPKNPVLLPNEKKQRGAP